MQYVEVRANHFINATLVREFQYTRVGSQEPAAEDQPKGESAAGQGAEEAKVSSLVITFSNGDQRVFTGPEADAAFTKLKATWD